MFRKILFIGILAFWSSFTTYGQKVKKVHSEYTYYAPENMSIEEAKRIALERAKIQACADEFGTILSQSNTTILQNDANKSTSSFLSLNESDVKGEWIETIGKPKITPNFAGGMLYINVIVEGKIREITSAPIDISAKVLCNGTTARFEREDFHDGDDLFLEFQSPINGYLTVYLVDMLTNSAYCLLPYRKSEDIVQRIQKDKLYLFFSSNNPEGHDSSEIDEYTMLCSQPIERNDLYIIFSPNPFVKANSKDTGELTPRTLGLDEFKKWLAKNQLKDTKTQVIHKILIISKQKNNQ